jgi:hypothetical protein
MTRMNEESNRRADEVESGTLEMRDAPKAPPINSAAFKNWFGDSKVVDENGEPLVFYHGAGAAFNRILPGGRFNGAIFARQGEPSGYGQKQHAIYVKGPILELDEMAGLLDTNDGRSALERSVGKQVSNEDHEVLSAALTDGSQYPDDPMIWDLIGAIDEADAAVEIQNLRGAVAKQLGFQTVRTPDEFDGGTVMILSSTQIKSATDNIGTYDPDNPDIRYQREAELEVGQPKPSRQNIFGEPVLGHLVDYRRSQDGRFKTASSTSCWTRTLTLSASSRPLKRRVKRSPLSGIHTCKRSFTTGAQPLPRKTFRMTSGFPCSRTCKKRM